MIFLFFICIFCGCITAREGQGRVDSVTYDENIDGSVTLGCQTYFQITTNKDSRIDHHSWIFDGQILTKNTDIFAVNPLRYNVTYQKVSRDIYVYKLIIPIPVQTDLGRYQCQLDYTWYGYKHSAHKDINITINCYLPPLNYPMCSIKPNKTLSNGKVEFICDINEATAQITLKWTLRSDDGSIIDQNEGTATSILDVRKTITLGYDNSMFSCEMTSKSFPTAYRNCSAGPLRIYEGKPNITEMSTQSTKLMVIESTTEAHHNDSTPGSNPLNSTRTNRNNSNSTRRKVLIFNVVGSASGALILSLLIILGVLVSYIEKEHRNTSPTVDSTYMPYQRDSEPATYTVLIQGGNSHTGTTSNPAKLQSVHTFEHPAECLQNLRSTNESITIAASSNQATQTVDPTYMPYQPDSESELNAVFNQTDDSHTGSTILPNKPEYQNTHIYEHTIKSSRWRETWV